MVINYINESMECIELMCCGFSTRHLSLVFNIRV